eukprot:350247-Chlamydomonas_euryale.AAC.6
MAVPIAKGLLRRGRLCPRHRRFSLPRERGQLIGSEPLAGRERAHNKPSRGCRGAERRRCGMCPSNLTMHPLLSNLTNVHTADAHTAHVEHLPCAYVCPVFSHVSFPPHFARHLRHRATGRGR